MYRRFRAGCGNDAKGADHSEDQDKGRPPARVDPEVEEKVSQVWRAVADVCKKPVNQGQAVPAADNTPSKLVGWQTVRIFVSSTFNDFFSEREVLVKKVFPELKEWCQERRVRVVECDLRWGVPKDATSTQALLTCLEEIDRCYDDNGQPFFLTMLGERYGWIPSKEEVPQEVRERYQWVDHSSMTFMEILHGALRTSNPNAAFFMRDPGFTSQLPDDHVGRFQGENALATHHMKVLKEYLERHFPQQVFHYAARFGEISNTTGRELVSLTGLDRFAEQVKQFFQTAIDKAYPLDHRATDLSPEDKERELQWLFIKDKTDTLIGRQAEMQRLLNYARGIPDEGLEKIDGKESTMRQRQDWDMEEGDSLLCVVTAQGGWGKTALLAGLVSQARKEGQEVMYHFVGSTATSGSHTTLLQRLLMALALDPADREVDSETDEDSLKKRLRKVLGDWRGAERQLLIVIDGANELDNSNSAYHLSWLPPALPPGVRCVISVNASHVPTTARLYEHPALHLALTSLNSDDLCDLAARFFLQYGKKLESAQLHQMVDMTKVDNPLWMTLMCEELRVFGDFRMMEDKLRALPDTMEAFLATVIDRLVREDETGYVKKTLYLMASSVTGLPTDDILRLLGNAESKTECAPLYWAHARRILKSYSRTVQSAGDATEYFTFVHEAMEKAVQQCMEREGEDRRGWHRQLADFYQYSCDNIILRINHLPRQLQMAGCFSRLVEFVRRDPHASYMAGFQRSKVLCEHRCRNPCHVVPGTREVILCQGCAVRSGGFNRGVRFPNRDVCYLCSSFVFRSAGNNTAARVCSFHAMRNRMGPNLHSCCVCGHMVMVDKAKMAAAMAGKHFLGPLPALLCQQCGFGINGKMCCMFKDFLS